MEAKVPEMVSGENPQELSALPMGWVYLTLDYLISSDRNSIRRGPFGSAIKKSFFVPYGYKVYEQGNVIYSDFRRGGYFIDDKKFDEMKGFQIKPGDVLMTCSGTVGRIAIVPKGIQPGIINQALLKIALNNKVVNTLYFFYLFRSRIEEVILANTRGSAMLNISSVEDLRQIPLAIPPLPEQHRIVAKIEELFTRLDAGVEALKKIKAQIKRYRQAVLRDAFEGKLTGEWREAHKEELEPASVLLERIKEERRKNTKGKYKKLPPLDTSDLPELPEGWVETTGDIVFSFVTSGSRGWAKYYSESGPIFLRMANLDHDSVSLDLSQIQRVFPPAGVEGSRTHVSAGDILISITADVGMVALAPDGLEEAYINQHIALARPVSGVNGRYLAWFLTSEKGGQSQFLKLRRGVTKKGLGLDDIRAINISLPPLPEQHKIIEEIEQRFSVADAIERTVDRSLKQTDRLRQSILKQAFKGKLVSQDPNDEPAEKLLERIREEKAKQQAENNNPKNTKRRTTKNKMKG